MTLMDSFAMDQLVCKLETAVTENDIKAAEELLQRGTDPNRKWTFGTSILSETCRMGHLEIARLLVAYGADVNRKTMWGETPLIIAAKGKSNAELAALLIENGANMNAQTDGGWTPLMCAAYDGAIEVVRQLVDNGADTAIRGNNGETAQGLACGDDQEEIVRLVTEAPSRQHHLLTVQRQQVLKGRAPRVVIRRLQP